jgi:hypothetical protein
VDIISVFPFSFIINDEDSSSKQGTELFKLAKLYRFTKFFRLIKATRVGKSGKGFINKMMKKVEMSEYILVSVSPYYFVGIFLSYFFSCLWHYFSVTFEYRESWIIRYSYLDEGVFERFCASLYYVYSTITTTGYGDIVPLTPPEYLMTYLFIFGGVTFHSLVYSRIL